MDVDCGGSSDSEGELRTPSYPTNLAQYPFGVKDSWEQEGMSVDDGPKVGVLGIGQGFNGTHGYVQIFFFWKIVFVWVMKHLLGFLLFRPSCNQIPRLVLSHPNPSGERSLWAVCQDCGAASPAS